MITIQMDEDLEAQYAGLLERTALAVLQDAGASGDASIVLADDRVLHELNLQYLGIDAPTDVLSFVSGEVDPDSGEEYLGDVIISLPRASAQAKAGEHALQDELCLLAVHGMLHLLGHDHGEPEEKTRMWECQARVLAALGCKISAPAV